MPYLFKILKGCSCSGRKTRPFRGHKYVQLLRQTVQNEMVCYWTPSDKSGKQEKSTFKCYICKLMFDGILIIFGCERGIRIVYHTYMTFSKITCIKAQLYNDILLYCRCWNHLMLEGGCQKRSMRLQIGSLLYRYIMLCCDVFCHTQV